MEYTEAKELIIRGKVGEALILMREPLQGTDLYDEWIVLSSRYAQLEEQELKGLISPEDSNIMHNRITDATLRLLDRAKADARVPVEDTIRPKAGAGKFPRRPVVIGLGILALLTLAYWVWPSGSAEIMPPDQVSDQASTDKQPERSIPPEVPPQEQGEQPRPTSPDAAAADRYDRYVIRKRVNNDNLPFELHYLGVGEQFVYLELTVRNTGNRDVEIKEINLLHSSDRSSASSFNLEGHMVAAARQEKLSARFRWQLSAPVAFRMKLIYRLAGERTWREVKNDFGVYQRAD